MIVEEVPYLRQGAHGRDTATGHDGDVVGEFFQFLQRFLSGGP